MGRPSEIFQIQQFIRLLNSTDKPDEVVHFKHRDKPDFVLSIGERRIGLEISRFTDEEVLRANHLHRSVFPQMFAMTGGLRDGSHRRSNEEIAKTMFNFDEPPCVPVVDAVKHSLDKMNRGIQCKRQKFQSPDFEKFPENWLFLTDFDNPPFLDWITDRILTDGLTVLAEQTDQGRDKFDRIYIAYGPKFFRLQEGKLQSWLTEG